MKFSFCALLWLAHSLCCQAGNAITLSNGEPFYEKALAIGNNKVAFEKQMEETSTTEMNLSPIDNAADSVYKKSVVPETEDKCMQGKMDAKNFHGKIAAHISLGFLFGVFGVLGSVGSEPSPLNDPQTLALSKNKSNFNDSTYLACYKKKAVMMNTTNALRGLVLWAALLISLRMYFGPHNLN